MCVVAVPHIEDVDTAAEKRRSLPVPAACREGLLLGEGYFPHPFNHSFNQHSYDIDVARFSVASVASSADGGSSSARADAGRDARVRTAAREPGPDFIVIA